MENNVNQIELKFQRFFISNFPKVKNYAQLLLKSEVDAEDVAQDIFCKLWLQPEIWLDNENELDNYQKHYSEYLQASANRTGISGRIP